MQVHRALVTKGAHVQLFRFTLIVTPVIKNLDQTDNISVILLCLFIHCILLKPQILMYSITNTCATFSVPVSGWWWSLLLVHQGLVSTGLLTVL